MSGFTCDLLQGRQQPLVTEVLKPKEVRKAARMMQRLRKIGELERGGPSQSEFIQTKTHQYAKDCRDNLARLFPGKIRIMGYPSSNKVLVLPCICISQQQSPVESKCCYFFYMRRYFLQELKGKLVMNWLVWPGCYLSLTPKEKCAG